MLAMSASPPFGLVVFIKKKARKIPFKMDFRDFAPSRGTFLAWLFLLNNDDKALFTSSQEFLFLFFVGWLI
jgi:hypothetical protein